MGYPAKVLRVVLCAFAALSVRAAADERTAVEASIREAYRTMEEGFARKDVAAIYGNCDPGYQFVAADGSKAGLAENRQAMEQSLAKVRSLHVKVEPEAGESVGANVYMVRYKQTLEVQLPLKPKPSTNWLLAEDTWEKKGGKWRLMSTKVVTDSATEWKARIEAQRKQMDAEDAVRGSRRCLNGLGYQCGPGR